MSAYESFEKIDAHMHYNRPRTALLRAAGMEQFRLVSINTEVPFFPDLSEQQQTVLEMQQNRDDTLDFLTTFSTEQWGTKDWGERAVQQVKEGLQHGAVGVKVWKNIGMELRDEDGGFVMIDHPSFDPVFAYCEANGIPVLGHLGEPKNCWLPIEEMTVSGDRDYFEQHPEYHMHRHPEYPDYEEQLAARDRRLDKHPDLHFVGAHLASLEWSVEELSDWLDRYPNCAVDLAERICHLQYQAVEEREKVREFVAAYSDRILYGTDLIEDESLSEADVQERIVKKWKRHWQFFASGDLMSASKVEQPFEGLELDPTMLKNIFRENALNWYPRLTI